MVSSKTHSPAVCVLVESDDVEIQQSAEILFREFKVRGLDVKLGGQASAFIVVSLNEKSLEQGSVELRSKSLDRHLLVGLEDAVDKTMEWMNELKTI